MSRKRLYRSSDAVISGVCGGIAEYFGIDSTLVRIIAVALTVVGLGLPAVAYVVLMIALPPDPGIAQGYVDAQAEEPDTQSQRVNARPVPDSSSTADSAYFSTDATQSAEQPPPPDPTTRVSSPHSSASEGTPRAAGVTHTAKNHSSAVLIVGAVLIGIGVITLLCNFVHVSVWRFWPVVIIVVGVVFLFTPGPHGWSLERAGGAIVLITIGLALLAWMFQIIQTRVFIAAFMDLWPVLLIAAGLSIIGSARKSSVLSLVSALVLSATILLGLWIYGGLDWASLIPTSLFADGDGIQEILSDISISIRN